MAQEDAVSALRITLNGEPRSIPAVGSLAALLDHLGLRADAVVVERNRAIVRRPELGATAVADGDTIEIVHFVGGG